MVAGTNKMVAIIKKHKPLNWNFFSIKGYNELNIQAPNKVHNVSKVATAEKSAPGNNKEKCIENSELIFILKTGIILDYINHKNH